MQGHRGFTLIEILVALGIFGVALTAMYGVYRSMSRTSVGQEGVVDIQQNLRVAMDFIGDDISKAGALLPGEQNPVSAATATSITLQFASEMHNFAMLAGADQFVPANAVGQIAFNVAMPYMASSFKAGDIVHLIRPEDGSQPLNTDLTVAAVDPTVPNVTLQGFTNTDEVKCMAGDMLMRGSAGNAFTTVTWTLNGTDLTKSTNGGAAEIVAQNITNLVFSYVNDTTVSPPETSAVQVQLTGTAINQPDGQPRQRSLQATYYLRNRR